MFVVCCLLLNEIFEAHAKRPALIAYLGNVENAVVLELFADQLLVELGRHSFVVGLETPFFLKTII